MKHKQEKKGIFLLTLIIAMSLLFALKIFLGSKIPNKPQNYNNHNLHFSLQYPSKYFLKNYYQNDNQNLLISKNNTSLTEKNIDTEHSNSIFTVQYLRNFIGPGRIENPKEWIKSMEKVGINYNQTNIGGKNAYFYKLGNQTDYLIYIQKDQNYDRYIITTDGSDEAQTILSTFKFTD